MTPIVSQKGVEQKGTPREVGMPQDLRPGLQELVQCPRLGEALPGPTAWQVLDLDPPGISQARLCPTHIRTGAFRPHLAGTAVRWPWVDRLRA